MSSRRFLTATPFRTRSASAVRPQWPLTDFGGRPLQRQGVLIAAVRQCERMSSDTPSARQQETIQRAVREQAHSRLTLTRIQLLASVVLAASTLLAWENHPRELYHGGATPGFFIRETSHSIGLATLPAGLLVLVLGLLSLGLANPLRTTSLVTGWTAFSCSTGALGVCVVEIVQLWIGRRNWLASLGHTPAASPLDHAVGVGVWVATAACVVMVATTSRYVWLWYRQWRSQQIPVLP